MALKKILENFLLKLTVGKLSKGFGAELNPEDIRDISVSSIDPQKIWNFPKEYITDISNVPVTDQLALGSCVGHAVGTELYIKVGVNKNLTDTTSRRWLYGTCKKEDGVIGEGTYPRIAYKIADNKGCSPAVLVPNNDKLSHEEYITIPLVSEKTLEIFKANGYAKLDTDKDLWRKEILTTSCFTTTIRIDFREIKRKRGEMKKPKALSNYYHRIVIYGYRQEGSDIRFFFRNSWGSAWGDKGNGSFLFSEWQDYLFDSMSFRAIPKEILEEVKTKPYVFTGSAIKFGEQSERVRELQKRLIKEGYLEEQYATGYFGTKTSEALLAYQLHYKVDDVKMLQALQGTICGAKTMAQLNGTKKEVEVDEEYGNLINALIQVESGGDLNAIGDKNLTHKAYGCLQIRQPYVDDVNRVFGTAYRAQDMLGNKAVSIDVFKKYMSIYATEKRLGFKPTFETIARCHNGGPNGWRIPATVGYWEKVKKHL